ncbi:Hypothetical predicted protein, partial [Mytilus galloprovincialis]
IDRTFDKRQDANLWPDGLFGRSVSRYLCLERCEPSIGRGVLVDVAVVHEKDACVDYTLDTKEKAIQKVTLCIRMMDNSLTTDAGSDLILLSKGQRNPSKEYTLICNTRASVFEWIVPVNLRVKSISPHHRASSMSEVQFNANSEIQDVSAIPEFRLLFMQWLSETCCES